MPLMISDTLFCSIRCTNHITS